MGDPAGVGPEVALRAAAEPALRRLCRPLLVGDPGVFRETAERLGIAADGIGIAAVSDLAAAERRPGEPTAAGAAAAYRAILEAAALVLDGRADAIVTAPVSKRAIQSLGHDFPGHTELVARLAGGADVRMMMAGRSLRVVLATTHVALAEVPARLEAGAVAMTAALADGALRRYFGFSRPRLALAGLNPHAGEGGAFGDEEARVLGPALAAAREAGIDVSGPESPDTIFHRAREGEFDGVVALYHDQGLIPFKLLHFRDGVNVTIGLPFPRTSPDHGTAFDIAGRRRADPTSMQEAMRLAARMAAKERVAAPPRAARRTRAAQ